MSAAAGGKAAAAEHGQTVGAQKEEEMKERRNGLELGTWNSADFLSDLTNCFQLLNMPRYNFIY
jgi:hypothetical protein